MRSLSLLAFLTLALGPARGQDYDKRAARGLAIYKSHSFDPDTSAVLVEYTGQQDYAAVTYFTTTNGSRIAVPNKTAEVIFLPYPGKGEATVDVALLLLETARHRFPQYKKHLEPLVAAWKREARRPRGEVEAEVSRRDENEAKAAKSIADLKSRQPPPNPLDPGPLLLDPKPKSTPKPTPEASGIQETGPAEDPAETQQPKLDLPKILQTLLQIYGEKSESP